LRRYSFLTAWLLEVERERVYDAVWESERWPEWWPGVVEATELDPGGPDGIGRRGRYEWRSRIPYPVRFDVTATRVQRPRLLEGRASGDLVGFGRWRLYKEDGVTAVLYSWEVAAARRWIRLLGPIGDPVFRWTHDQIMRAGAHGLADLLDARLLAAG
jgi:hypothetical protein